MAEVYNFWFKRSLPQYQSGIIMWLSILSIVLLSAIPATPLNLEHLDPTKLQTIAPVEIQKRSALNIIQKYSRRVKVEITHQMFENKKDSFHIKTLNGVLHIRASTGVAAVWGFNYYLKKYCKSQIEWQTQNVKIPSVLPIVNEKVVANDRFRYYQNVCTVSYSFVWWNVKEWKKHIAWMALNGINLSLAPVAQEAIWARVYQRLGMTTEEIEKHFTGPAFLSWLRMGKLHGWGGPLPESWHKLQVRLQISVIKAMIYLGIAPVLPAFNGHVPDALSRIYPERPFHRMRPWKNFEIDYCCSLFVNPQDPLFLEIGTMFFNEMGKLPGCHIYLADPFTSVVLTDFDTEFVKSLASNIFMTMVDYDSEAVWLLQNMIFVGPYDWPKERVEAFLGAVPNGRILILDLQAEHSPKYDSYDMYFGQPFIWCMLHNFGGTLGMFGNMVTINKDVYEVRSRVNSTMIGIGLTPEGINQNYVVYDLMLESAWRKAPVQDLDAWAADYAERRYGCNDTAIAWKYLLKSVYSYEGYGRVDGSYIITRKPSFKYTPWSWYKSSDLIEAFRRLIFVNDSRCDSKGYRYDVVDVTRQVLQYRIDQLFNKLINDKNTNKFEATVQKFLDAFEDVALILATDVHFLASGWFTMARAAANSSEEADLYEYNAWNQITWWGPNGQMNDYACKQWSEMVSYYYRPGWAKFLYGIIRSMNGHVEYAGLSSKPMSNTINILKRGKRQRGPFGLAQRLYNKWLSVEGIRDLPVYTAENPVKLSETFDYEADYESD